MQDKYNMKYTTLLDIVSSFYNHIRDSHFDDIKDEIDAHIYGKRIETEDECNQSDSENEDKYDDSLQQKRIEKMCKLFKKILHDIDDVEIINQLIEIDPHFMLCINPVNINENTKLKALKINGDMLQYIDDQTAEMCNLAINRSPTALKFVKDQTYELCVSAVSSDPYVIKYVNDGLIDYDMCMIAIMQDPSVIKEINKKYIDYNLCMKAVEIDGRSLQYIDQKFHDHDLCMSAIKKYPRAFKFVRKDLHSIDMCTLAVSIDNINIKYIDKSMRTTFSNKQK